MDKSLTIEEKWTLEEQKLIKEQIAPKATDDELKLFMTVCINRDLDPFANQIYCVHRYSKQFQKDVMTIQVGIDGMRTIASRTNQYAGNDDPVFDGEESGHPTKATVTVYRMVNGTRCPFTATARWSEYYPGDKMGFMWKSKPHVMLGKCAEALALRKAFPEASGLYVEEELQKPEDAKVLPQESEAINVDELIEQINECKTAEELQTKKEEIARKMGPMNEDQRQKIMAAGVAASEKLEKPKKKTTAKKKVVVTVKDGKIKESKSTSDKLIGQTAIPVEEKSEEDKKLSKELDAIATKDSSPSK